LTIALFRPTNLGKLLQHRVLADS